MRNITVFFMLVAYRVQSVAYDGGSTEIDTALQSLLTYLTSAPARIIAIIAIVSVGYATLYLGVLPKQKAISVVIGIGIIFGAAAFLKVLGLEG